jgi:[FeFe] hydrogenase H-cluster maturation GTPase HydF
MILPQVQTLRDVLDANAMAVFTKEHQLAETLGKLSSPPKMVITDSQAFAIVSKIVPETVPLTSFSILMARYKGFLETSVKGAAAIKTLKDGDTVLISEGCTHHRQCGDIGSVKLPALLKKTTGKELNIELSSGREFPEDLSRYSLVIHCGGCMLGEREMTYRRKSAEDQNVPFTNYGIALALMNGILKRSLEIFPHLAGEIE